MEFNTIGMMIQPDMNKFNPISNYNQFLKGNASFDVNKSFQNDFDMMLQREMNHDSKINASSSPVENMMNLIQGGFSNTLNDVNEKRLQSDALQEAFARGENVDAHDLMIAAEKSTLSMQMAMQVRNKIISAYNDIKNMSF
jgi:flagellar hook-basal body complex protein FliE